MECNSTEQHEGPVLTSAAATTIRSSSILVHILHTKQTSVKNCQHTSTTTGSINDNDIDPANAANKSDRSLIRTMIRTSCQEFFQHIHNELLKKNETMRMLSLG